MRRIALHWAVFALAIALLVCGLFEVVVKPSPDVYMWASFVAILAAVAVFLFED